MGTVFHIDEDHGISKIDTSHGGLTVEDIERFVLATTIGSLPDAAFTPSEAGTIPPGLSFTVLNPTDTTGRTLDFSGHTGRIFWRSSQAVENITMSSTNDWVYTGVQATFLHAPILDPETGLAVGTPLAFSHIIGTSRDDSFQGVVGQTLDAGGGRDYLNIMGADTVTGGEGADVFRWIHTATRTGAQSNIQVVSDFALEDTFVAGAMAGPQVSWSQTAAGTLMTHVASGRSVLFEGALQADVVARTLFENGRMWVGTHANDTDNRSSSPDGWALHGLGGVDHLYGGQGGDKIYGDSDNDRLWGHNGDDSMYGGAGNDSLYGGDNHDRMWGGSGNDLLRSESFYTIWPEYLYGDSGNDTLDANGSYAVHAYGGTGEDVIWGGGMNISADFDVFGGDGNDTIVGAKSSAGTSFIYGGNGNDLIDADFVGRDTVYGDAGSDLIHAMGAQISIGPDVLFGGTGRDVFAISAYYTGNQIGLGRIRDFHLGEDRLHIGDDMLGAWNQATRVQSGTSLVITFRGHSASFANQLTIDNITWAQLLGATHLGGDVDALWRSLWDSSDTPSTGSTGAVLPLVGNDSNNTLSGSGSNDKIEGRKGADTLSGWDGDDTLDGGEGADSMVGGTGNDTYVVDATNDVVVEGNGAGIDTVVSSVSYVLGTHVERLVLSGDTQASGTGNSLANTLTGNNGANLLDGKEHDDVLDGGLGNDTLDGGLGRDALDGQEGDDLIYGGLARPTVIPPPLYVKVASASQSITGTNGRANFTVQTVSNDNNLTTGSLGSLAGFRVGNSDSKETHTHTASAAVFGGRILFNGLDSTESFTLRLDGVTLSMHTAIASGLVSFQGGGVYGFNTAGQIVRTSGTTANPTTIGTITILGAHTTVGVIAAGTNTNATTSGFFYEYQVNTQPANILGESGGNDSLLGGDGNDTLFGGDGNDLLNGGDGNDALHGGTEDDRLDGREGDDSLYGGDGRDELHGGTGADLMEGGNGDDVYTLDDAGDVVAEAANGGIDTVRTKLDNTVLAANLEYLELLDHVIQATGNAAGNWISGNAADNVLHGMGGNDSLEGNGGNDTLYGGDGNDEISAFEGDDHLYGGAGNDSYLLLHNGTLLFELANEGQDSVASYVDHVLAEHFEYLELLGDSDLHATGNSSDNLLIGNTGHNALYGGGGNDLIVGEEGDDHLEGGEGQDTLYGATGDDTLVGGTGSDLLEGAEGDDLYIVASSTTVLREFTNNGHDTLHATVSYTLQTGVEIERLALMGTANLALTGNGGHNTLVSNLGDSSLYGGAGNDTLLGGNAANSLFGGTGNDSLVGGGMADTLDGGAGSDRMEGGEGDDVYIVDDLSDGVWENDNGGHDEIHASVSTWITAHVETLRLIGTADISGDGDEAANTIFGNSGDNGLDGGAGDDTLHGGSGRDYMEGGEGHDSLDGGTGDDWIYGGAGDDTLEGGDGHDQIDGDAGNDILWGGSGNDGIQGGAGNDTLHSSAGNDLLSGGEGDDVYFIDHVDNTAWEEEGEGNDTVFASVDAWLYQDNAIERLELVGDSALMAGGNDADNTILGNSLGNQLWGEEGHDTLEGRDGHDTVYGGSGDDGVFGGAGNDVLVGEDGHDSLEGGDGDDVLVGDAGNDTLVGGAGQDFYEGGAGDDLYLLENAYEHVSEEAGGGEDTIRSTADAYLGDNVEHLVLVGPYAIFGGGNQGDNTLTGSAWANLLWADAGNDTLWGGSGNDTLLGEDGDDWLDGGEGADAMEGEAGDDTYVVDHTGDVLWEEAGMGYDTVFTSVSISLSNAWEDNSIERVVLTGTAAIGATGNASGDLLEGNGAGNTLRGLGGADTLDGQAGDDALEGGDHDDLLYGGSGADDLVGGAGDDVLVGGEGTDRFLFAAGTGADTIVDFLRTEGDTLVFQAEAFAPGTTTTDVLALFATVADGATTIAFQGGSVRLEGVADLLATDLLIA